MDDPTTCQHPTADPSYACAVCASLPMAYERVMRYSFQKAYCLHTSLPETFAVIDGVKDTYTATQIVWVHKTDRPLEELRQSCRNKECISTDHFKVGPVKKENKREEYYRLLEERNEELWEVVKAYRESDAQIKVILTNREELMELRRVNKELREDNKELRRKLKATLYLLKFYTI